MGLLDNYGTDPLGMGLLQAGAALMTPRAYGGGVAGGLLGFNQGAMQAMQYRRALEQDARRNKLVDAQIGEFTAQTEERKRKTQSAEAAQREMQSVLADIAQGAQPQFDFRAASAASNAGTPYAPAAPVGPTITQAHVARWIAAGGDPKQLEAIVSSRDWGRPEVAGTLETTDPQGRPVSRMRDKYGNFVGDAMPKPYEKKLQDTGGAITAFDPYTLAQSGAFAKTQTPDSIASNATTIRGQNMTDARARAELEWKKTQPNEAGKAPAGYRWKPDGSLEPIPGGPSDPAVDRNKPPTEGQSNAYLFASRAKAAADIVDALGNKPSVVGAANATNLSNLPLIGGALGTGANATLSPDTQRYMQAKRDFINAVLRKESGAVIGKDEFASADLQYFPQPFDSAAVKQQKAEARRRAIEGLTAGAGPLAPRVAGAGAAPAGGAVADPLGIR